MKKMMFLMLTLMLLGAANVSAQVKIGGDGATGPVTGAVLELDGSQGALLLPRVDALTEIASPVAGMQVYLKSDNQVYIFDGTKWNVYAGPAGATGAQGPKGDTGATGAQGPQGDKGATGAQGPKGDTGATGPQGQAGPVNMRLITYVFQVNLAAGETGNYNATGVNVASVCNSWNENHIRVHGVTAGVILVKAVVKTDAQVRINCVVPA